MNSPNKTTKKFILIIVGVLIVACLGVLTYSWQEMMTSRDKDIASLNAKTEQLNRDNQSLSTKNNNLGKVVKVLQNQLDKNGQTSSSSDDQTLNKENSAKPVAKIVVRAVKDQPGSDFTLPGQPQINGNLRAVHLTIANLTDSPQTYNHIQFEATLDTGAIVKPHVYAPQESTTWNSSTLDAGVSQDIVLLFGTDQNLVTLNWSPIGALEPLVVTLPASIPLS